MLFPWYQHNTLKKHCISDFPFYLKNAKGNYISLLFPYIFFPSPFTELFAVCTQCTELPQMPQATTTAPFLHKWHWCGARHGSLTKRWFFPSEQHTHSAWAAVPMEFSKGKQPKHVCHINRIYVHSQSRPSEWNSLRVFVVSVNHRWTHLHLFKLTDDHHTLVPPAFFSILIFEMPYLRKFTVWNI